MFLRFIIRYKYSQGLSWPSEYRLVKLFQEITLSSHLPRSGFSILYFVWHSWAYGEHVCSMNRLVLTDEEDAEYHAFESVIATHDACSSSKVMLCTFHAVWQPFKRDVYNLLPSKKSSKGKLIELTEVGKQWGENWIITLYYFLPVIITNIKI